MRWDWVGVGRAVDFVEVVLQGERVGFWEDDCYEWAKRSGRWDEF